MKITFANKQVESECRQLTRLLLDSVCDGNNAFSDIPELRKKGLVETLSGTHVLTSEGEGIARLLAMIGI